MPLSYNRQRELIGQFRGLAKYLHDLDEGTVVGTTRLVGATSLQNKAVRRFMGRLVAIRAVVQSRVEGGDALEWKVIDYDPLEIIVMNPEFAATVLWANDEPEEEEEPEEEPAPEEAPAVDPYDLIVKAFERCDSRVTELQETVSKLALAMGELSTSLVQQSAQRDSLALEVLTKVMTALNRFETSLSTNATIPMFVEIRKRLENLESVPRSAETSADVKVELAEIKGLLGDTINVVEAHNTEEARHGETLGKIITLYTESYRKWAEAQYDFNDAARAAALQLAENQANLREIATDNTMDILRALSRVSHGERFNIREDAIAARKESEQAQRPEATEKPEKKKKKRKGLPSLGQMLQKKEERAAMAARASNSRIVDVDEDGGSLVAIRPGLLASAIPSDLRPLSPPSIIANPDERKEGK